MMHFKPLLTLLSVLAILFACQLSRANGLSCAEIFGSNYLESQTNKLLPRSDEEYEKIFGIPSRRNTNTSEYNQKYAEQLKQIHEQFMAESSENMFGIVLMFGENNLEAQRRWLPYLKEIMDSKSYLNEKDLLLSLKKWDLEIAKAVENSILKSDFELYFYRDLSPNEIRKTTNGRIITADDDWAYNPQSMKHAFLWFKNLPKRWASVLNYEPLEKGRFGQSLYRVKLNNKILQNSTYTLGDMFESSEKRNISDSGFFDPLSTKESIKKAMQRLYGQLGVDFKISADDEKFGTFHLTDRRGLMLYLFLAMENNSRYRGTQVGLSKTGLIQMPYNSWIDVQIKTALALDKNVEAMDYEVDIPQNASVKNWEPMYITRKKYGFPDRETYLQLQKEYDSKKYGSPDR